jgi:hypothetical protein
MTAGIASRAEHPQLAVMNKGDDLRPGRPGHGRGSVTRKGARGCCRGCCCASWRWARITLLA